jgi:diguanylate cyclase (GGDEF)-like protein
MVTETATSEKTSPFDRRKHTLEQLSQVRKRVWYLWFPSVTATFLLALGIAVFVHPHIRWGDLTVDPRFAPGLLQLVVALVGLVLLEAIYIVAKVRELRELRGFILTISQETGFYAADHPRDALTGVLDRRVLPDLLKRESSWVDRYRIPLSMALFDIRDFSGINEKEGNLTGDLVLKDFGKVVRETIRQTDSVVRYGADQFLCLLPRTDRQGSEAFVRRVGKACQGFPRLREIKVDSGIGVYEAGNDVNITLADAERELASRKESARHLAASPEPSATPAA